MLGTIEKRLELIDDRKLIGGPALRLQMRLEILENSTKEEYNLSEAPGVPL